MPLNADDLASAFNDAGISTKESATALLSDLSRTLSLRRIDIEIEGLNQKQADALRPFQDLRIELMNKRAEIAAQLPPAQ